MRRIQLGERQRLAAARVLLNKPQAVMIDDALTALDEVAQRAIFQAIRDAVPQVTVLVLSRHPICADCFDQVLPLGPHQSGIQP